MDLNEKIAARKNELAADSTRHVSIERDRRSGSSLREQALEMNAKVDVEVARRLREMGLDLGQKKSNEALSEQSVAEASFEAEIDKSAEKSVHQQYGKLLVGTIVVELLLVRVFR